MHVFIRLIILLFVSTTLSCSNDEGLIERPAGAALIFPKNNSECTEGEVLSVDESKVTFEWTPVQSANTYTLLITEIEKDVSQNHDTEGTTIAIPILKGKLYSWKVISRKNGTGQTGQSDTWYFYNAGGSTSHPPFPAKLIAPDFGSVFTSQNNTTLNWDSVDLDGDIKEHHIYVDNTNPPTTKIATQSTNSININTSSIGMYYWQIETIDQLGNKTSSPIFKFEIE